MKRSVLRPDDRYLAWVQRVRRCLATSGALSQTALRLSQDHGGTPEDWKTRLQAMLNGRESPSIELIIQLDAIWAKPVATNNGHQQQDTLF
ncbi:MAG: hypothetical protein ACO3RV_08920 [Luteolibacter sp.]